jgi:Ser/Thr protein kinase RdoA (MazF antagonist)
MSSAPIFSTGGAVRIPRIATLAANIKNYFIPAPRPDHLVGEVLEAYGLPIQGAAQVLPGAVRNETWLVRTAQGKKVLKRYRPVLLRENILHEHSILTHLARQAFPVPHLVTNQEGETLHIHQGRLYALMDYLDGYYRYSNYFYIPGQARHFCYTAGLTLGKLHRALDGFRPAGFALLGFDPKTGKRLRQHGWYTNILEESQQIADRGDPLNQKVIQRLAWMQSRLSLLDEDLARAGLEQGVIHGDYGSYNLLVRENAPVVVLDFELASVDWRILDLVEAFSRIISPRSRQVEFYKLKEMIRGYRDCIYLERDAVQLIPQLWEFIAIRRLIQSWGHYVHKRTQSTSMDISRRLDRLDWITCYQSELAALSVS